MTLRASLQKLKQNIAQLKEGLLRASSSRRMYPFFLSMSKATEVMRLEIKLVLGGVPSSCINSGLPPEGGRVFYTGTS